MVAYVKISSLFWHRQHTPDLDLRNSKHVDQGVGYGHIICVFKCNTQVGTGHEVQEHHSVFIEEL
jgi:hypothetical protein